MLFRSIPVYSEIRHFYLSICLATILYMISCYPSSAYRYLLCDAVDIATANDDLPCKRLARSHAPGTASAINLLPEHHARLQTAAQAQPDFQYKKFT